MGGRPSKVGSGLSGGWRVKLWKDKWCGDLTLRETFTALFSISFTKDAWVAEI